MPRKTGACLPASRFSRGLLIITLPLLRIRCIDTLPCDVAWRDAWKPPPTAASGLTLLCEPDFEDAVAQIEPRRTFRELFFKEHFLAVDAVAGLGFEQQNVAV